MKNHIIGILLQISVNIIFSTTPWEKAVEFVETSQNYYPGSVETISKEFTARGKLKKESYSLINYKESDDGQIITDIIQIIENEKDITELVKSKQIPKESTNQNKSPRKKKELNISFSKENNPFLLENKEITKYKKEDKLVTIDNEECYIYSYQITPNKDTIYEGNAYISKNSKRPIKFEYEMDPNPKHVKNLNFEVYYQYNTGLLYINELRIIGDGGFLFSKVKIEVITKFEDYFYYKKK